MQQAENTLKEAFPTIDAAVVRAVLRASGGNVEPAFNALLGKHRDRQSTSCRANALQACRIRTLKLSLLRHPNRLEGLSHP